MDVNVPTCPEWTLVDLGTHLGQFCGFWSHVLCEATERPKAPYTDPDPEERRPEWFAAWFEGQAAQLVDLLKATDHGQAVWTWDPSNGTAGFIARRAAHELAIHRFDVEATRSVSRPVDGQLAVDGIEEIFAMVAAWRAGGQDVGAGEGETLHLHAFDPAAEWTLTLTPRVWRSSGATPRPTWPCVAQRQISNCCSTIARPWGRSSASGATTRWLRGAGPSRSTDLFGVSRTPS